MALDESRLTLPIAPLRIFEFGNRIARKDVGFAVATFVVVFGSIVAPRAAPLFLGAFFGLLIGVAPRAEHSSFGAPQRLIVVLATAAVVYLFARSAGPNAAASAPLDATMLCLFILLTWAAMYAASSLADAERRAIALAGGWSVAGGALCLVIDFSTSQALVREMLNALPILRGTSGRHFFSEGDQLTYVRAYFLNRNVGALNLIMWPILALLAGLAHQSPTSRASVRWLAGLLVVLTLLATFLSYHQSSMVAVTLSIAVFFCARRWGRRSRSAVATAWVLACLCVVPVAEGLHAANAHINEHIPKAFRARIVLWHNIAVQLPEHWPTGRGVNATRETEAQFGHSVRHYPMTIESGYTGRHPHNVYMQVWYELGFVGILFFCAAGLAILREMSKLPPAIERYALAAFVSAASMIAFSWSIWQHWLIAALLLPWPLLKLAGLTANADAGRCVVDNDGAKWEGATSPNGGDRSPYPLRLTNVKKPELRSAA